MAGFVKQFDRRLGTVVTFARQAPQQPVHLFCQDESRLGLHLPTRRRPTGAGVQPYQIVAPLYEYSWLYGAVEPATGKALRIDVLDSQVRASLTALRDHVADIVRRYTAEAIASLTGYPYLVEVARAL